MSTKAVMEKVNDKRVLLVKTERKAVGDAQRFLELAKAMARIYEPDVVAVYAEPSVYYCLGATTHIGEHLDLQILSKRVRLLRFYAFDYMVGGMPSGEVIAFRSFRIRCFSNPYYDRVFLLLFPDDTGASIRIYSRDWARRGYESLFSELWRSLVPKPVRRVIEKYGYRLDRVKRQGDVWLVREKPPNDAEALELDEVRVLNHLVDADEIRGLMGLRWTLGEYDTMLWARNPVLRHPEHEDMGARGWWHIYVNRYPFTRLRIWRLNGELLIERARMGGRVLGE